VQGTKDSGAQPVAARPHADSADVFETIFATSPLAIISFTMEREVLAINPTAERLLGWKASEVVGKKLPVPASVESSWQEMRHTLENGRSVKNVVTKRFNKAGEEITILISAAPVIGPSGEVHSFTTVLSETAPMVRLERALEESEQRRSLALQAANIGSWCYDLRTRNVEWDARCKELFGAPERTPDLGLEEFVRFIHSEDREDTRDAIFHAMETKTAYDMRHRVLWPDGTVHWLRCKGDFDDRENPTCLIGISVDVTWLKRNEELLRSVERLKASAEIGSTLAHEVNNPMEILCNALYLLESELGADHHAIAIANDAYTRIAEITKQMLAVQARPSRPELLDVAVLAKQMIEECDERLRERDVTIRTRLEPAEIQASPLDVKHLLRNLLENAIEHARTGRIIEVRTCPARERRLGRRAGVRVVVADNGAGIPGDLRKRLFQPFTSTKERRGAGLGLWTAQAIARKYEGFVRIRSSVRPGRSGTFVSVFLRTLPLGSAN
jgi:PAS domain S-box-containing protein